MRGPYRLWHHTHTFGPRPWGHADARPGALRASARPLGEVARRALVNRDLERIFDFRRDKIEAYFTK